MKQLTEEQRYTISVMINQGHSQTSIALAINKNKSVVCRELSRNCDQRNGVYKSDLAQRKHDLRQKEKYRHRPFNDDVKQHVEKLDCKEAWQVVLKTIEALRPIMNLIHTITADNGKEFAYRKEISKALDIGFYFARPYHSWERGGMKIRTV